MQSGILGILYLVGAVLTTLVVTILFCRYRLAKRKKSFFLIAIACAVLANTILFFAMILLGQIYVNGLHILSSKAWTGLHSFESILFDAMIFVGIGTSFCVIPALVVAFYFERRSRFN